VKPFGFCRMSLSKFDNSVPISIETDIFVELFIVCLSTVDLKESDNYCKLLAIEFYLLFSRIVSKLL